MRPRKWWGWGYEDDGVDEGAFGAMLGAVERALGDPELHPPTVPLLDRIGLRPPRFTLPAELADFVTDGALERVAQVIGIQPARRPT